MTSKKRLVARQFLVTKHPTTRIGDGLARSYSQKRTNRIRQARSAKLGEGSSNSSWWCRCGAPDKQESPKEESNKLDKPRRMAIDLAESFPMHSGLGNSPRILKM
jgi:hypothetical protein